MDNNDFQSTSDILKQTATVYEGTEEANTCTNEHPSIEMAFRWWADEGPKTVCCPGYIF